MRTHFIQSAFCLVFFHTFICLCLCLWYPYCPCTFISFSSTHSSSCLSNSLYPVSHLFLSVLSSIHPPPLLLWTSWAAENTEPEDRMSESQLPWKAMGRHNACIRPDDWSVWVSVSVCTCVCLSTGIWVNLLTTVCSSAHTRVWKKVFGFDSSGMFVCVQAHTSLCHVMSVCVCVCIFV